MSLCLLDLYTKLLGHKTSNLCILNMQSSLTPLTITYNPHIYGTIHLNRWMATHICEHNHPVFASIYLKTCVTDYAHGIARCRLLM